MWGTNKHGKAMTDIEEVLNKIIIAASFLGRWCLDLLPGDVEPDFHQLIS